MDIDVLRSRAAKREPTQVRISYSEEQLAALKSDLARIELERDDEDDRFAEVRTEHNVTAKTMKAEALKLKSAIRRRYEDVERECLLVPNHDSGQMEVYDATNGMLVASRRMTPEERQLDLVPS